MGRPFNAKNLPGLVSACSAAALLLASGAVTAQSENAVRTIMEEVQVTARKRADAEQLQEVPVAVTAYSGDQLDALHVKDLQGLAFKMPNVQLDDVGTIKTTANFTVRGLGVNSSIPSIDPTVGVFVDGVYLGMNTGVVMDMFDLEGIEVLRGPQGLLFGRNVTGGAVLIKTAKPTEEFTSKFKVSTTDGLDTIVAGTVSGSISDRVNGRLTAYYNHDDGYFENKYTGNKNFGETDTWFIRPSFSVDLTESSELLVRMEHGRMDSDGVPGQNRGDSATNSPLYQHPVLGVPAPTNWDNSENSFELAIDEEGYQEGEWSQVITEYNHDVAFGNGTITNILAWREYSGDGTGDIDSTPLFLFHANTAIDQSQWSNELRYAGRFGATALTTGVYWLKQDLAYFEQRLIPPSGIDWTGGGKQDHETLGVFAQADIDLSEQWVLTLGGRWSSEEKDARIATLPLSPLNQCNLSGCANYDFEDSKKWTAFTPKAGLQWNLSESAQVYGFWTQGVRSGGYNMRNTHPAYEPGPTDQEEQTSFEIGAKADWMDGLVRTNMALFHNKIDDMQREENFSDGNAAVVQVLRNTADATIRGAELEVMAALSESLLLTMNAGYVDGYYRDVKGDLNGDTVVDAADKALEIPRLAPWTWGLGLVHELQLGDLGSLSSRINYNHRDASPYTDSNRRWLSEVNMLDMSFGFTPADGNYRLALFGKNLRNQVSEGNNTELPDAFGGPNATFTPLNKGRVIGLELSYEI